MRLEQPAPIRKPLPLTPLVDIVFLLLMFFMLTSNFTKFGNLDLGLLGAASKTAAATPSTPPLVITIGGDLHIRVNGLNVKLESLPEVLDGYAAKGLATAVVRPGKTATVQDLVAVLEKARTSGLRTIKVAK